jgi:hypothetical protein
MLARRQVVRLSGRAAAYKTLSRRRLTATVVLPMDRSTSAVGNPASETDDAARHQRAPPLSCTHRWRAQRDTALLIILPVICITVR